MITSTTATTTTRTTGTTTAKNRVLRCRRRGTGGVSKAPLLLDGVVVVVVVALLSVVTAAVLLLVPTATDVVVVVSAFSAGSNSGNSASVGGGTAAAKKKQPPRYNFGPVSSRDRLLYTSERPGNDPRNRDAKVPDSDVEEWIRYVKSEGITHVVALLDENELHNYLPTGLLNLYERHGLECFVQPMKHPNAASNIYELLQRCDEYNNNSNNNANNNNSCREEERQQEQHEPTKPKKVVTHCTGGVGRCGRAAGGWLVRRYRLTPREAADEIVSYASRNGIKRKCDAKLLEEWLSRCYDDDDNNLAP